MSSCSWCGKEYENGKGIYCSNKCKSEEAFRTSPVGHLLGETVFWFLCCGFVVIMVYAFFAPKDERFSYELVESAKEWVKSIQEQPYKKCKSKCDNELYPKNKPEWRLCRADCKLLYDD